MTLSEISLPVFVQMLNAMTGVIDKAAKHAADRKYEPASLLHARLFPNMYDFARQIQALCDWPIGAVAQMTGATPPKFDAKDESFEDLKARIAKTLAFVQSTDVKAYDASAERVLDLSTASNKRFMKGKDFIVHRVLPQFYFHMTAAYSILRTNGLDLSKGDYMGKVPGTKAK